MAKLLSELDVVQRNIYIMSEIMTETEPGKETTEDVELLDVSRGGEGGGGGRKWRKREEKCWVLHDLIVIYVFFKTLTVMCVYMCRS